MPEKKVTETVSQETKFKLSKLRENARALFDVSTSTFDGATCSLGDDKEYTKTEVKNIIDKWLKKEAGK
ncbi:MAG: hypothetical protein Q4D26_09675 [Clostridia bacterium]|nr:hypothetical protein [Clostridia bacterium]